MHDPRDIISGAFPIDLSDKHECLASSHHHGVWPCALSALMQCSAASAFHPLPAKDSCRGWGGRVHFPSAHSLTRPEHALCHKPICSGCLPLDFNSRTLLSRSHMLTGPRKFLSEPRSASRMCSAQSLENHSCLTIVIALAHTTAPKSAGANMQLRLTRRPQGVLHAHASISDSLAHSSNLTWGCTGSGAHHGPVTWEARLDPLQRCHTS
jgi:hypothetical protein